MPSICFNLSVLFTQPKYIGPQDVLGTSPTNVPRTFLKDPISPPQGRPNLKLRSCPYITSWGRPYLMFKGHPWEVDSGCPQDVHRTSPGGPSKYANLDFPKIFFQN